MRFPNAGPRLSGQTWQLVVDGDSNTDQAYATSQGFTGWWLQMQALLSGSRLTAATGDNFATSGYAWSNLTARQSTLNAAATATRSCLLLMCGTNDRLNNGSSAATMLGLAQTYLNGVSGYEAIGLMQIPALGGTGNDAVVTTYNAGLSSLTKSGVPLFVITRPTLLNDFTNTTYYISGSPNVHLTGTACGVLAASVKSACEANLP